MSLLSQSTVSNKISLSGVGIHTGKKVKLKVSSKGIKTVEKKGGIDNYVITSKIIFLGKFY